MNIAIIGAGNVGGTLALAFRKAGHSVVFGVRDAHVEFKGKQLAIDYTIAWFDIAEAVAKSEVVILCTPANAAAEVAQQLGDVSTKIIIDTMNSVFTKLPNHNNTSDVILDNCNCIDVVKCFNTTGFENMANPIYDGDPIDMFVAGSSEKAKRVATQLAKDIGFGEVFDFGDNDKFNLIEQWAMCWINLAIIKKQGRNIAFKVIKRTS